jgi:branched-chain amino acid transport system substrate-binding protein
MLSTFQHFLEIPMLRRHFLKIVPSAVAAGSSSAFMAHSFAQNARDADAYQFANTCALTGPLGSFGQAHKLGVDAAFLQINTRGGVHGRKLQFNAADDAYAPTRSTENIKKILADNDVLGLIGCLGTPSNTAITPLIEATTMAHLGPLTGATSLRRPDQRNIFHVRASYTNETRRLVQNLVGMGIKDLAMVYSDNSYGKEVLADAVLVLGEVGIKTVAQVALSIDGKNTDAAVASLRAAKPSAVLLGTAGAASAAVVAALRRASPGLPIACISPSLTQEGIKQLGLEARGIAITLVFPNADLPRSLLVRDYQAALKTAGTDKFSSSSLDGYISGRLMAEALQRSGRAASREKIRAALGSIRNHDLGGFQIDFSGKPHEGSRYVELGILSADGKLHS